MPEVANAKKPQETPEARQKRLQALFKSNAPEFWNSATHTDAKRTVKEEMSWEEYRKLKGEGLKQYWATKPAPNADPTTEAEAKEMLRKQFEKFKAKGLVKGDLKV